MRRPVESLRPTRAADTDAERQALMAVVRSTGARGGRIDPHRSIATMDLSRRDVAIAVLLMALFTALYVTSLPLVGHFWTAIFTTIAAPLGMAGGVAHRSAIVAGVVHWSVPYFATPAPLPTWPTWWVVFVLTAIAVGCSFLFRNAYLPLGYALRFAAIVQSTALLYFAIAPQHFPYDLASYISGMMLVGAAIIGIVPLVLGLTFYVIDVSWSRKIALTVMVMVHLLILVPLQYALQSAVIVQASLLLVPLSFILFAILPQIMVLIALYGWGMSWMPLRARGRRQ